MLLAMAADAFAKGCGISECFSCEKLPAADESSIQLGRPSQKHAQASERKAVKHSRIIVREYGGPEELQLMEEDCPEPKDGEVRVRVLAAGVALPDVMMREGIHPETPTLPFRLGSGWNRRSGRNWCLRIRNRTNRCRAANPRCVRGVHLSPSK